MRIRSHLDPTLFVIFWHVDAREYDEDFRRLVRSMSRGKGTDVHPIFDALRERESRIFAHEQYHFWQGLRLPFLHLYASMTFRSVIVLAGNLAKVSEDWRGWADLGITATGFRRLDRPFYLAANRSGQIALGSTPFSDYEFTLKSSPKEMLECAASIFDFQTSCKVVREISDPESFRKWCKRHPAYLRIFDFLKDYLNSDRLALRTVLPLINAAFHTSDPERAFVELAARIWGGSSGSNPPAAAFLAQNEPCRWHEVFQQWLTEIDYDYPLGEIPNTVDLDDHKFYYLEPEAWLGVQHGQGIQHPFIGPLAVEWQQRTKEVAGLDSFLDMPGYIANKEARQFAGSAQPTLYVIRIFSDDGFDRVFPIGPVSSVPLSPTMRSARGRWINSVELRSTY